MRRISAAEFQAMAGGKAKATRTDQEGPLHKSILRFLQIALPPDAVLHHSPNELDMSGADAARQVAKARSLGTRKGWGDLEFVWRGRFYMIEVKHPNNTSGLSKEQAEVRQDI